jgi:eukaryotic-like serine/threonine-protein kinase
VELAPEIFGAYVLLRSIGRGATGAVYLARPRNPASGLPPLLVVKRLLPDLAAHELFVRRFEHEAQIATTIDSPYLAKIFDVGRVEDSLYIAMEHISGWPLSRVIEEHKRSGRKPSLRLALRIASDVLAGLDALHGAVDRAGRPLGIIHRDVSPKNIMLREDGGARLIDLGIGKSRLRGWKTQTGLILGTPGYMPPEQVRAEELDARSDLYAFAIVLWELLSLERYIEGRTMQAMLAASLEPKYKPLGPRRGDVPSELDRVLERALSIARGDRFASAKDFAGELHGLVTEVSAPEEVATEVGEALVEELEETTSVTSALLETPLPTARTEPGRALVFAVAPGVTLETQKPPARSSGLRALLAAIVLTTVFILGIAFERSRRPEGEPQKAEEPVLAAEPPRAVVTPPSPVPPEPAEPEPAPVDPAAQKKPKRKPTRAPSNARPGEPVLEIPVESEVLESEPSSSALAELLARARAIEPRSSEVERLIIDISLVQSKPGRTRSEIRALEGRLRSLEERPVSR